MEDKDIVDLYWERAESAITETDAKYGRYCGRIAGNILYNQEDTEECVSDTWMSAWNAMPDQRPTKLSSFLGRITRNLALDRYDRRNAKKRGGGEPELLLSELEDCLPDAGGVETEFEQSECAARISAFLREASAESRNIFLRRYWFADSIADISARFGISESKVKSALFRTRGKLRKYLEKEGVAI